MNSSYIQRQLEQSLADQKMLCSVMTGKLESKVREQLAKQFGDNGFPNRFPISGGICDHWNCKLADELISIVHLKQDLADESLEHWKRAGRRANTWRKAYSDAKAATL